MSNTTGEHSKADLLRILARHLTEAADALERGTPVPDIFAEILGGAPDLTPTRVRS